MDAANIASITVAVIAALAAWGAQRTSAKASMSNTSESSRVEMEKEAYDRARAYDTETIKRQDAEIAELRAEHAQCAEDIRQIKATHAEELEMLRNRIARLERGLHNSLEDLLRERLNEPESDGSGPAS